MPEDDDLPFVSVAIIIYNEKSTVEQCLSSLEALDYPRDKYEVVVVDGGSTDGTLEVLQKFPVKVVYEKRKCRGLARNKAVSHCNGQIIAFTDADCIPARSWLKDHVLLHKDPEVLAVAGAVIHGGDRSLPAMTYHRAEFSALSPLSRRRQTWEVATCNASFKRRVFNIVGLFPELHWGEDCLLSWRILQAGYGVLFDPSPKVVHIHETMTFWSVLRKLWRQGYSDFDLQHAFGEHAPYKLPRTLTASAIMSPSMTTARLARYFVKFWTSSARKMDPLLLLPILFAASLAWTAGYLASASHGR